jgi:hypothetical protein
MNTLINILYILLGSTTFIALLSAIDLFLPEPVERARRKLEAAPLRSFAVGILNMIFWVVILVIWFFWSQYDTGPGFAGIMIYLIGSLLLILLVIGLVIPGLPGLVALAQLTGARFKASASPLGRDLRGGLLLVLACMTPFIGWFILTPALLSTAIGAGLLTFFERRSRPQEEERTA